MDDVEPEDERNMKPAALDCEMLKAINLFGIGEKEERAYLTIENALVGRDVLRLVERNLAHLSDLFLKSHFLQEICTKRTLSASSAMAT